MAFGIAYQAMDIDMLKRDFSREVRGHHHHAGDPEEDNVKTCDQHARRQILLQSLVLRVDGFVACPIECRERPERRGIPSV